MGMIEKLRRRKNYVTEFGEEIPVVNFDTVEMKDLRSLTSHKVGQVIENNWLPNGLLAWDAVEDGSKLNLVYFKGRAAVVTTFKADSVKDINEALKQASSLCRLEMKKIIHMCV